MGGRDEVMGALGLYLYKSHNTIAYKTGSGDKLNVKGRDAESDWEDQVVNGPARPLSMEGIDGPQRSGTGPAARSLFVHSPQGSVFSHALQR